MPGLDVGALTAIDVHTHAETDGCGHYSLPEELRAGADKYFGVDGGGPPTLDQLAAYYRERKMAAVVFTVDAESALGHTRIANEAVIEGARRNADVLLPFASIDPAKGRAGVTEARRLVEELGVRGFKFHPSVQAFHPNDPSVYPLYEVLEELGVPAALPQRADRHRLGAAAAAAGSGSSTPTRCTSTTWPSTSPT